MDNFKRSSNTEESTARGDVTSNECYGCCGSGHILVEAYDLMRDIYLERGYRRQDIPRLILEKNLYGLDIDEFRRKPPSLR